MQGCTTRLVIAGALESAFVMLSYSNRKALVQGFDENLNTGEKRIGTGVIAYDTDDGFTIIICINEPNSMLSLNQMRHSGIDVCDVHPKFLSRFSFESRLQIKRSPFILITVAAITFPAPAQEELDTCEWITLTSDAH